MASSDLTRSPTLPETGQPIWTEEEIASREGDDISEGEWYGIKTDPWPCPACGEVFEWVTGAHFVIVADQKDDLLMIAAKCKEIGRNPKIQRYDGELPVLTIWNWRALGMPVHGMKKADKT